MKQDVQVVYTHKARCRDCYKCIRVCPVKAIKMQNAQASVVRDRCIACGTCIKECPQKAKKFRDDLQIAKKLVTNKTVPVIASIAPSFASLFKEWQLYRIPSALRQLGFDLVCETAVGAMITAELTKRYILRENKNRPYICTPCPATVTFCENYHHEAVPFLVPIVSPMIAHAIYLKKKYPNSKIIFIGPCTAKKAEIERDEYDGLIDCALTFKELQNWISSENINIAFCEEGGFDETPGGDGRIFPINGGITECGKFKENIDLPILTISGADEIKEAVDFAKNDTNGVIIDPLFCLQGCINGPASGMENNIFERKRDLIKFTESAKKLLQGHEYKFKFPEGEEEKDYFTTFQTHDIDRQVTEHEIREMLEKTGKSLPENQLNCGACGYNSCKDKTVAVVRGLAEEDMCIPLMRRRAEQKSDKILEKSPNGIVVLDDKLSILNMNNAFKKFLMAGDAVIGRHISYLLDPSPFESVASGLEETTEGVMNLDRYGLVCHYLIYGLENNDKKTQYVGIFANITSTNSALEKLSVLKKETIELAGQLLEHELNSAQKYAALLGENTAKTEQLVNQILRLTT